MRSSVVREEVPRLVDGLTRPVSTIARRQDHLLTTCSQRAADPARLSRMGPNGENGQTRQLADQGTVTNRPGLFRMSISALLMRFGFIAHPGFKSPSLRH